MHRIQLTPKYVLAAACALTVATGMAYADEIDSAARSDARALAVASNKRMTALPDVPTAAEAGLQGYESYAWLALLAPANIDRALVDKLYAAAQDATQDPKLRALFAEQGAEPMDLGPEDLKKFMASEILKWSQVIGKMGIAPM